MELRSFVLNPIRIGILVLSCCILISNGEVHQETSILRLRRTEYSNFHKNVTYLSSTVYYPRGMKPIYKANNDILNIFLGEDAIPEGYIEVVDGTIQLTDKATDDDRYTDLLRYYWPLVVVIAISGLMVVLMPVIGLCFCCCRCAGACGGRTEVSDKKHDTCRRFFYGLFLLCLATGFTFGVVLTFITNAYMQQGIDNATTVARYAANDLQLYMNTTSEEIDHMLVKNYGELANNLHDMLDDSAKLIVNTLKNESKAISLTELADFLLTLPKIEATLSNMQQTTSALRTNATQLSDGLRGVKRNLLAALSKCNLEPCNKVLKDYEIGTLDKNGFDYDKLPDLTDIINSVSQLQKSTLMTTVLQGSNVLEDIYNNIYKTVQNEMPTVDAAFNDIGAAIKSVSVDIQNSFISISSTIGKNSYSYIDEGDYYINEYGKYRFFGALGIACLLLLILLLVSFGLICGICGKRPNGYGDDCCSRGAGSSFLMCGVAIIFLTISVLTIIALALFLCGLIVNRAVCVSLRNPSNDQIFGYIDQLVDLNQIIYPNDLRTKYKRVLKATSKDIKPFPLSDAILSCHRNESAYQVLRLENIFDITVLKTYPEEYKIAEKLNKITTALSISKDFTFWGDENWKDLDDLAESGLAAFDVYRFSDNLNDTITRHNLNNLASQLESLAKEPTLQGNEIVVTLKNQALHLQSYQQKLVEPMVENIKFLLTSATELDTQLKFNSASFKEAVEALKTEIKTAETYLKVNGTEFIQKASIEFIETVTTEILTYLNMVINRTSTELGRCGPISRAYEAVLVGGCNEIINPFNGFWAGLGWCLLLFLPMLILSVKLASLYRKSDPYPGQLIEAEYLYDAYSERDHIPRSNAQKNKRRKTKERRRSSYDNRGDYYEESSGSPHRIDGRYHDMAPKHWDSRHQQPPRYQNPPMAPAANEYERPPPYYYAGASDD